MFGTNDGSRSGDESEQAESRRIDRRLYWLIGVSTLFGAGHHVDHLVRGNHVGWPVTPEVTVFTYTLVIYPLIGVGLYLTVRDRVGFGYWSVLTGAILSLVVVTHFGPWAVEPLRDVIGPYQSVLFGYAAVAWLLGFVASLVAVSAFAVRWWLGTPDATG